LAISDWRLELASSRPFGWDIGELFGGQTALISRVIYVLVGLSALVMLKPKSSPVMPQM